MGAICKYKGDDNQLIHNYRPISVLPLFSNRSEKIVFKYVLRFLDDNNILYEYQFGFRKHHSKSHAIITLVERVTKVLDTGKYIVGVFLDLKKAFNTVYHCILLNKLETYGIKGNLLNWFKSYLSFSEQFVERGPISSFYILMTFLNHLIYCFQYYLQITQVCSLRELHMAENQQIPYI